ncbi:hypothetical protein [Candidatus Binatus sp.]|uniref:hypothetical protein n=1 Tax=Candidatus Binatus sp. TaxID=2811406 RepID=UPI003C496440
MAKGIVQFIREKLGAAPDALDSSVLAQAMEEALGEVSSLDSEILAREQRLGRDSIESPDGGEAAGRELQELRSKRDRLTAKCESLGPEIANATEREMIAELEAQCDIAEEKKQKCEEAVRALSVAIDAVIPAAKLVFATQRDFVEAAGDRNASNWGLYRNLSEDFCDLIAVEAYLRSEVNAPPRLREMEHGTYGRQLYERLNIERFMASLRGCAQAMRSQVQDRRERGKPRPSSKAA